MADQILISKLCVSSFIGATEEERRRPQRLDVSLVLEKTGGFAGVNDVLERTIDYAEVAQRVKEIAVQGQRLLIETLAEDVARVLLENYPLAAVEVEVCKHILPETEHVGVRIRRAGA
jgi:dihydroneopterin aldolase